MSKNFNYPVIVMGAVLVFAGVDIMIRGVIRLLEMGDAKWIIGGATLSLGLYFLYLGLFSRNKE